ncbi:MAG: magnesium chelatase subunit [Thermosediminibacterales bacterium]|nr:magnesium chelatase subunit [Thermosediminibacterales bacterium]
MTDLNQVLITMKQELNAGRGFRVGESAVVSNKVHMMDVAKPGVVNVIYESDAGSVFYGRKNKGEVIHIDIFHQMGEVEHVKIANRIIDAIGKTLSADFLYLLDNIDVQTATGGGRITGSLNYGDKPSLKKAHLNHVHLALLNNDILLEKIIDIINEVEKEIENACLEIRKIEKICNDKGKANTSIDLSHYSTYSDSQLKQNEIGGQLQEKIHKLSCINEAVQLARKFGSVEDVINILKSFNSSNKYFEQRLSGIYNDHGAVIELLNYLQNKNILEKKGYDSFKLTQTGHELLKIIELYYQEIEAELRKLLKKIPINKINKKNIEKRSFSNFRKKLTFGSKSKKVVILEHNAWIENLALPETVITGLKRCFLKKQKFCLEPSDIRVMMLQKKVSTDICILLDASASMSGNRLKSAKFLAEHLVLSTSDKISVITFQEKNVDITVAPTKNYKKLQQNINKIKAFGLTPLALGLKYSIEYIQKQRFKNPLLLLITDGIPTVPLWTSSPLDDALKVAETIARKGIRFCCIGLAPNKDYMNKLVKTAQGSLYVVEEIDKDVLINIVHQERHQFK